DPIAYWNEQAGPKWVAKQEMLDAQLALLGECGLDAAALSEGERVLDVGCGCGASTLELVQRVGSSGEVVGIDVSKVMLARARERARVRRLENIHFQCADAQVFAFDSGHFDALTSRFGVMFFSDPGAAFANLLQALRPGGRLAFVCWQPLAANPWMHVPMAAAGSVVPLPPRPPPDAPGPFSFGDPERVDRILREALFDHVTIDALETTLSIGGETDLDQAVDFVLDLGPTAALLREVDETTRSRARSAVREALSPYQRGDDRLGSRVEMPCAVWLVRARRAV
ncbi:MAG: class I SAM-dependent methyltransferase, partial [Myxococcota bacterium]